MYRNVYRPAAFHGPAHGRGPYFEGWYFKMVAARGGQSMAVIPGVFYGAQASTSHAFVQTLDGPTGRTSYHRYPLEAFRAHATDFALEVGPNLFSSREIVLDLEGPRRIQGVVRHQGLHGWPVTLASPGIMGWYSYVPYMECCHGVVGFDHALNGMLAVDNEIVDFHGGRGYIEKDWGEAFPSAWIWMQSNHFAEANVCLTGSVARIPWRNSAFRGFIVGLWRKPTLYRFATYTGARIEQLEIKPNLVRLTLSGPQPGMRVPGRTRLEIVARRPSSVREALHAPQRTAMVQRVLESLTATLEVRLTSVRGRPIFEGTGTHAGLELGGDVAELL